MIKNVTATKSDAEWYDTHHYAVPQKHISQWYAMLLPRLISLIQSNDRILEVGCGISPALSYLGEKEIIPQSHIYGIEQSKKAIEHMKQKLPKAHINQGDLYHISYGNTFFDYVLMLEVIEHLGEPQIGLTEIARVIKRGGTLFLSFPNFSIFPWRVIRWISDTFNLPQLINKQPIDTIYTIDQIITMAKKAGFELQNMTGVTYFTAALTPFESLGGYSITRLCNSMGFGRFSLHPLFEFKKI